MEYLRLGKSTEHMHTHTYAHICRLPCLALCREATDVAAATNQTLELSKFSEATYE